MDVQLLGLCKDPAEELGMRRQLVIMSALMKNDNATTEAKIIFGTDWVDAVKNNYRAGDMIVSLVEQRVGLFHRPLNQILEANLNVPVYVLSGIRPLPNEKGWFSQIVTWFGFIATIIGFGILQIKIAQLPKDWLQSVLFILSTILELWLIWIWNNFWR